MDQISVETSSVTSPLASCPSVETEVASTLETLLLSYKDRKKGIKVLARKMGAHEKTLARILNFENKPGYQTVFKIYRVFFNEYNDAKVMELVPEIIRTFLIKSNAQILKADVNYTTIADKELQSNPVLAEIYVIVATGPVQESLVSDRFGTYGIEILRKMITQGLIREIHAGVYGVGNNHPVFDGETIVSVGKVMIANHAKPGAGEMQDRNFISFFAEGLSEDAYQRWINIDEEAYRKKFELTRDPKNLGNERAFTFMISEKIKLDQES